MRIGINALFLIPGGVGGTETYARGLLDGLEILDKENEYIIFCNKENFETFQFSLKNFQKIPCPINAAIRPLRILYEQFILPFQIWQKRIDVLLSLGYVCPLFLPCKSIVVIYDLNWFFHPEEFSFFQRLTWKILVTLSAKRADHIITSSENSKKDIARILKINPRKISVVYGGVDRTRFKPAKDEKEILAVKVKYGIKDKFIFTVSAAYKFKNLGKLIDAFGSVVDKYNNVQLLIVGLGGRGKKDIVDKIRKYQLEDKVIIAGWVPDEDIPVLYTAAQIYVHPSLYEGFGFPPLEAMACGCPVISSNSAPLPELIGEAGLLVDARNNRQIADTIKEVLTDLKLRKELVKKGEIRSHLFNWEKSAQQVQQILIQTAR